LIDAADVADNLAKALALVFVFAVSYPTHLLQSVNTILISASATPVKAGNAFIAILKAGKY